LLYLTEHFYQKLETPILYRIRRGRHRMVHVQSVSITTKVVSSNPVHGEVYFIHIMSWSLSVTCDRSVVFTGYSGFLHQ